MNEHHIKTLRIENFKSIKDMELECSRINVFVGKPNVGKSNVLEALSLFGATLSKDEEKYFSEFVRYNQISNLFYDNNTDQRIIVDIESRSLSNSRSVALIKSGSFKMVWGSNRKIIEMVNATHDSLEELLKEEKITWYQRIASNGKPKGERRIENLPEYNSIKPTIKKYTFLDDNKITNGQGHPFSGYLIPPYGENLVLIMENNKEFRDKVAGFFSEYGYEILLDFKKKTFEIQKRIDNISYKTDYNLIADTLQRMIFHHAAILSNKNSVILFEEPESHAYPPYISELAEAIIDDENNNQYFLTTHSPFIFNKLMAKTKENELAAFIVHYENYETKLYRLTDDDMSNLLDHGADIFYNLNWFIND